ncbi:DUF7882 family protein [Leucobacter musarum]|uniref:DUF7882 family protein n=1 Tax=Leucobacter musarum TaxID=1930747 RepID=UPI0006A7A238|nr:hypothetical protein [Leucobacter musarum]
MGYITHGNREYEFEDRTLAHLKVVIGQKLSRREPFFLSWSLPIAKGSGRYELWISEHSPIAFRFSGGKQPELNQDWLRALLAISHSSRGLVVLTEMDALKWAKRNPVLAA